MPSLSLTAGDIGDDVARLHRDRGTVETRERLHLIPRRVADERVRGELEIDLASSYTLGDRNLDVEAGRAAGTKTILVSTTSIPANGGSDPAADFVAPSLADAAKLILTGSKSPDGRAGSRIRLRS